MTITSSFLAAKSVRSGFSPAIRMAGYLVLAFAASACSPQASAPDLIDRARLSMQQGNARAAEIDVRTALQQNPDSAMARRLLGEIYLFQHNSVAAVEEFERALAASEDADTRILYAQALVAAGRGELLLEMHKRNDFSSVADHPRYLVITGSALADAGDLLAAGNAMDAALAVAPDDPYVSTFKAFFLLVYSAETEEAYAILQDTVAAHPDHDDAWSLLANVQRMNGDLPSAESSYARAAELNSYRIADRLNLVTVRLDQGKTAEANAGLAPLVSSYPDHPGVNFLQGRMLVEAGDHAGALTAFFKVLNVMPDHPGALYLAAVANINEGNLATAQTQLTRLVALEPDDESGRLLLSNLHLFMNDPAAAERLARNILRNDDNNYAAMGLLATALTAQGAQPAERIELYQRMASARPDAIQPRLALASALRQVNDIHGARATYGEAEEGLRQALITQPDNVDLHKLLIDTLMNQGKLAEAETMLADLPADVAKEPVVLVARGRIAMATNNPVAAEAHFRAAMHESPASIIVLWLDGAVRAQGRGDEAIRLLADWVSQHPDDLMVRNQLATSYLQTGRDQEALEQYRKIVESAPDNMMILNNLAWLLRESDPEQALAYIERAHTLVPGSPQVLDTYAMVQAQRGANGEALSLNQQALDLAPNNPELLYHRAMILRADGKREEAIGILEGLVGATGAAPAGQAQALLAELQGQ